MNRKPSRKTLKLKLDKLFSEIVRSLGYCLRCRNTENLQCAHIYSRRFLVTRWDFNNALCLCSRCHRWGHDNPLEFSDLVIKIKGVKKAEELRIKAKVSVEKVDFAQKLEELKKIKEGI